MEKYDILFYKGSSIVSKVVSLFTGSPYTHVALIINDELVIDIDWRTTLQIRKNDFLPEDYVVKRYIGDIHYEQDIIMDKFIYSKIGSRYDYLQILYHIINKIFGREIINNPNYFTCSEFIDRAFMEAGIDLVEGEDDGSISPADLFDSKLLKTV